MFNGSPPAAVVDGAVLRAAMGAHPWMLFGTDEEMHGGSIILQDCIGNSDIGIDIREMVLDFTHCCDYLLYLNIV